VSSLVARVRKLESAQSASRRSDRALKSATLHHLGHVIEEIVGVLRTASSASRGFNAAEVHERIRHLVTLGQSGEHHQQVHEVCSATAAKT